MYHLGISDEKKLMLLKFILKKTGKGFGRWIGLSHIPKKS